jgi:antitoxin ParD1/3/4
MTMNVSVGQRWEAFVADIVKSGRYSSASEVMREGLRLVEEREERLAWLRDKVNASIERGGANSPAEVRRRLAAVAQELDGQGY